MRFYTFTLLGGPPPAGGRASHAPPNPALHSHPLPRRTIPRGALTYLITADCHQYLLLNKFRVTRRRVDLLKIGATLKLTGSTLKLIASVRRFELVRMDRSLVRAARRGEKARQVM